MRYIVCGGRKFEDRELMAKALERLPEDAVLVHGAAPGADSMAADIWTEWGGVVDPHPADWTGPCRDACRHGPRKRRGDGTTYCPAAGNYRNQEMLDSGVDLVVAVPGGSGTANMIEIAEAAGILVERVK
jgi:hypothetical protein